LRARQAVLPLQAGVFLLAPLNPTSAPIAVARIIAGQNRAAPAPKYKFVIVRQTQLFIGKSSFQFSVFS
jgi:hypothetical protein